MDIGTLECFVSVYLHKNITKAAIELNISQQGLSKLIKTLEDEVNVVLFTRNSAGVVPTLYGDCLYNYANTILSNYQEMKIAIDQIKMQKSGIIKIGIAHSVMPALNLELPLAEFMSQNPQIHIEAESKTESECETMLVDGTLNFAFIMGPLKNSCIYKKLLYCENINVIMRKDNPLAVKKELKMDDLIGEQLICGDKQSRGYERLMEWFYENHKKPQIAFTSNEPSVYRQLVKNRIGIGLCPAHILKMVEDEDIISIPLSGYRKREVYMCCAHNKELTMVEEAFSHHISKYYIKSTLV
ncbi:MAG: transcriptional regulator LysR family [Herbinix sp.]|nr:transcriptional regulator LysR family [Herbinix sp.]